MVQRGFPTEGRGLEINRPLRRYATPPLTSGRILERLSMDKKRTHNQPEQLEERRRLRHKSTPEEWALWQTLKGKQIEGLKWRRQFSTGAYILDFYCPSAKICIEVDGIQHQTEEHQAHDRRKDAYLAKEGIRVIRVPNNAVWHDSDMIIDAILDVLGQQIKDSQSSPKLGEVPEGRMGL